MKEKSKTAIVIGENITKARGEMRQKTLALKLYGDEKYQSRISKIERGVQEPKASDLAEIAAILNVSVDFLQGKTEGVRNEKERVLMVKDPEKHPHWSAALTILNSGDEVGAENAMWDYLTRKRGLRPQG